MRRLLVVGAVTAVAGLVVTFVPSLAAGLLPAFGAILAVGLVAVLLGVADVRHRLTTDQKYGRPAERETRRSWPTPGDEFDRRLAELDRMSVREAAAARATVRERLEAAALNVLAREGIDPETARILLESGGWTDDPVAASFFADERDVGRSPGEYVRGLLSDRSTFQERAERTAAAVAVRAGATDDNQPIDRGGSER